MTHVALLCEYGTINGGENSILAMIDNLPEFRFSVIAPPSGRWADRLTDIGLRHFPFSFHDAGGTRVSRETAVSELSKIANSIRPDLLHANSLSMGRLTGPLSAHISIPCTAHVRDILRLSRSAINDLNRNDRLIAVSHAARDAHVAQGLNASRTHVVYNGIDTSLFQPRDCREAVRNELGIPRSARLVGTIGQIGRRKGWDVLIRSLMTGRDRLPDVHLMMVGERFSQKDESIRYESDLHSAIAAAALDDRVHWLGHRNDVPRLLNAIDLLVHPARQEPLGRVLLEAAACGVPIIASDVGGTGEILTDRVSALLVPPDDPAAVVNAMGRMFCEDELRARLGRAARAVVCQRFEIHQQSQAMARHWLKAAGVSYASA